LQHDKDKILSVLKNVDYAVVATVSGVDIRTRMMHFWNDENFNVYLASMKGDPKTLQLIENPSVSLLVFKHENDISDSTEVEIIGRAFFVKDKNERSKAFEELSKKSPVVKHLKETGNLNVLDCIKIIPVEVKYRIFREIVKGDPPTIIEFPQNEAAVNEFAQLKRKIKHWIMELRAPFLTATIIPILLGTSIAWAKTGIFDPWLFLLTFLAGIFLHLGTNVINDYFDYKSGNDEINREFVRPFSGGSRMIQLGLLTPSEVLSGAIFFFILGISIGLYLVWLRGWIILLLGIIGVVSGLFYTSYPFSWASLGVGETLVGVNFGVLMSLGAYYVQTQSTAIEPLVASIPVALLITAVLYVNEFPDYNADKTVGKSTLVVRLGREKATWGYLILMATTYISILLGVLNGLMPIFSLMGIITLPLAIKAIKCVLKYHSSSFDLVPANALTITCHALIGSILFLGYIIEGINIQILSYLVLIGIYTFLTIHIYRAVERRKNIASTLKKYHKTGIGL